MYPMPELYTQNQAAFEAIHRHYATVRDRGVVDWTAVVTKFIGSAANLVSKLPADPAARKEVVVAATVKFVGDVVMPAVAASVSDKPVLFGLAAAVVSSALPVVAGSVYDGVAAIFARVTSRSVDPEHALADDGCPHCF